MLGAPGAGSPVLLTKVKLSQIAIGHQIVQAALKLCQQAYELHLNSVRLKTLVREQQAIIDHISDGLLVLDGDGRVSHLNEPAGRILAELRAMPRARSSAASSGSSRSSSRSSKPGRAIGTASCTSSRGSTTCI